MWEKIGYALLDMFKWPVFFVFVLMGLYMMQSRANDEADAKRLNDTQWAAFVKDRHCVAKGYGGANADVPYYKCDDGMRFKFHREAD